MINFSNFLQEEKQPADISEEEIDEMVDSLTWKDIEDLYNEDDFVNEMNEAISASERLKRSQRMRVKEPLLTIARKIKLKRASPMPILKKRSQLAARNLIYKKIMKNRDKSQLSPSEKDMIELRVKRIMQVYKNLPQKLMPKIRELERSRLAGA